MPVTSLGYQTDLALRALEGSKLTEYTDCVVVRSPANPAFRWGNFVLLREQPERGEAPGWIARFGWEFPGADYAALALTSPRRTKRAWGSSSPRVSAGTPTRC